MSCSELMFRDVFIHSESVYKLKRYSFSTFPFAQKKVKRPLQTERSPDFHLTILENCIAVPSLCYEATLWYSLSADHLVQSERFWARVTPPTLSKSSLSLTHTQTPPTSSKVLLPSQSKTCFWCGPEIIRIYLTFSLFLNDFGSSTENQCQDGSKGPDCFRAMAILSTASCN